MARFNTTGTKPAVHSPVTAEAVPSGVTHEGAPGFARDSKSELFLLAVSHMGDGSFYESQPERDRRFRALVHGVAMADPEWMARFVPWLRDSANMRTASVVAAAEAAKALLIDEKPGGRQIVASALKRADEPGELLAYWTNQYGRAVPKPVKRGIADAVERMYDEYNLLKYDTASHGFRFGDVIDLCHPGTLRPWQGDLYRYALDRRHGRDGEIPESLSTIRANAAIRARAAEDASALLDAGALRSAGMTWEDALSLAGSRTSKRDLWTALIPLMGYMACLAEGTQVWLPDGTTAPIEEVVARRLPVLAPERQFDTSAVRYGPSQPKRDRTMAPIKPVLPSAWHAMGLRPVVQIDLVSGRSITATLDHRWVKRRRNDRRESWEWVTTSDLSVGDTLPAPIGIDTAWGDQGDSFDGYFVGAMLGDGCMTNHGTPEFAQVDDPSRAEMFEFMHDYAAKYGCVFARAGIRKWRITFPAIRKMNPVTDILRHYEVWGLKSGEKRFPNRPLSREFWIGALSGLIDTDGHIRIRVNPKGTVHASVEYATISETMARQVADAFQRLGIQTVVAGLPGRPARFAKPGVVPNDLFIVSVNRAASIKRAHEVLTLRHAGKAAKLAEAAGVLPDTPIENVEMDRIAAIGEPFDAEVYCVTVDRSSAFVANGVVTGNCLRNLRNFDDAGVADDVAATVAARLADPEQVARSRQFPFRFLSAYRAAPSLRWAYPLEKALAASLANVPRTTGRTLILVDRSGSMFDTVSAKSGLNRADTAALFGTAVALRCDHADLVEFGTSSATVQFRGAESLLKVIGKFGSLGGTHTADAVRRHYRDGFHSRVVIITDEQVSGYSGHPTGMISAKVPVYTWNLAGYQHGHGPSGSANRHTFGGLSDHSFKMISLLESGRDASWPWENESGDLFGVPAD